MPNRWNQLILIDIVINMQKLLVNHESYVKSQMSQGNGRLTNQCIGCVHPHDILADIGMCNYHVY